MKIQCQNNKVTAASIYFHFFFLHQEGFFLIANLILVAVLTQAASYLTQIQPVPGISAWYAAYPYRQYTMILF